MSQYHEMNALNNPAFKRIVGVSKKHFEFLLIKVNAEIEAYQSRKPITKRGIKGKFSTEDKLLMTLYYLRHYPTFIVLGQMFSISESYAHDIVQKFSALLVNILPVEGLQSLHSGGLSRILMDVTEQPIERPKKGQKAYYSGKKKTYNESAVDCLCSDFNDSIGGVR